MLTQHHRDFKNVCGAAAKQRVCVCVCEIVREGIIKYVHDRNNNKKTNINVSSVVF